MSKIQLYQGDCLELMKQIPDKSIDMVLCDYDEKIKILYCEEKYTMRRIAEEIGKDHHFVKRRLKKMNIETTREGRSRKPITNETREKISEAKKRCIGFWKGKKMPKKSLYKNMKTHCKRDIELDFFEKFEDIERLKILNNILTRDRVSIHFDDKKYKDFIEKFYYDKRFIEQCKIYEETKNKYDKPSLDHIKPLSRGGSWELDNLQIVSWFENRAKCDLLEEEFSEMVKKYLLKERIEKAGVESAKP